MDRRLKTEFDLFTIELRQLLKKYGYRIDTDPLCVPIVVTWYDEKDFKGMQAPDELNQGAYGFEPVQFGKGR